MYLQKLARNKLITVAFYTEQGVLRTIRGRVYHLNLFEQSLSLIDENHDTFSIQLSLIRKID